MRLQIPCSRSVPARRRGRSGRGSPAAAGPARTARIRCRRGTTRQSAALARRPRRRSRPSTGPTAVRARPRPARPATAGQAGPSASWSRVTRGARAISAACSTAAADSRRGTTAIRPTGRPTASSASARPCRGRPARWPTPRRRRSRRARARRRRGRRAGPALVGSRTQTAGRAAASIHDRTPAGSPARSRSTMSASASLLPTFRISGIYSHDLILRSSAAARRRTPCGAF